MYIRGKNLPGRELYKRLNRKISLCVLRGKLLFLTKMTTWKLLNTGFNSAAYNMALDEELLARAEAEETVPVLRFYGWHPSAVSIGKFQNIETAIDIDACKRHGIDLVRRVTGGRAVLHHQELSYSIIARTANADFPPNLFGTYKAIAQCLLAGLENLGIHAEIVSRGGKHARLLQNRDKSAACFSSPSWYEIVVGNRKIIGSAQRRLSRAFLQHGSILVEQCAALEAEVIRGQGSAASATSLKREVGGQLPPREEIEAAFVNGFAKTLGITFIS